jgi:hypothetical protein
MTSDQSHTGTSCSSGPVTSCPITQQITPFCTQYSVHLNSRIGIARNLATVSACTAPSPPQESLVHDGTRTSLPAKPSPNPDDFGPIVHRPMGLAAATEPGLEPRISSGTESTAMQCHKPLHHSGGRWPLLTHTRNCWVWKTQQCCYSWHKPVCLAPTSTIHRSKEHIVHMLSCPFTLWMAHIHNPFLNCL